MCSCEVLQPGTLLEKSTGVCRDIKLVVFSEDKSADSRVNGNETHVLQEIVSYLGGCISSLGYSRIRLRNCPPVGHAWTSF